MTTAPNIYLKLNNGNIANIYFEKAGSVLVTDVVASEGLVLQRQWNVANCLLVLLSPEEETDCSSETVTHSPLFNILLEENIESVDKDW